MAGLPTTPPARRSATSPTRTRRSSRGSLDAGALCLGKPNLDQFATGLSGVRSPYGVPKNLFDGRFIVGGSSSGSAVAVAAGLVDFALGTDTAGSGRVPAAFNNIVGLKPSRGLLSTTRGRSRRPLARLRLDLRAHRRGGRAGGRHRARLRRVGSRVAARSRDVQLRRPSTARRDSASGCPGEAPSIFSATGAPPSSSRARCARLAALGGERVEIDFAPFREAGALVYDGAFIAERLIAAGRLLAEEPEALVPPVRAILRGATSIGARAAFDTARALGTVAPARRTRPRRARLPVRPDHADDLPHRGHRARSDPAQRRARHVHHLRQSARSRRAGCPDRLPERSAAGGGDAGRAVGQRRPAGGLRLRCFTGRHRRSWGPPDGRSSPPCHPRSRWRPTGSRWPSSVLTFRASRSITS